MALSALNRYDTNRVSSLITKAAHGFVAGDVLRFDGSNWVKAIATASSTFGYGVVVKVISTSVFELGLRGFFTLATSHGLTIGTQYYLSTTLGVLTSTAPTFIQKILIPLSATDVLIDIEDLYTASVPVGGTTGQALVKNSNSNYDTTWSTLSNVTGSFTSGQVAYATGTSALTSNSNFAWDSSSRILTISGNNNPRFVSLSSTGTGGVEISQAGTSAYVWNYDNGQMFLGVNNIEYFTIRNSGRLCAGNEASQTSAQMQVQSKVDVTDETLRLKLMASQSGKLLSMVQSDGTTILSYFDNSGELHLNTQKKVYFRDSDSSNYVSLGSPPTVGSNVNFLLPSADGTNGQAITTNASGTLGFSSFLPIGGGTLTGALTLNADPVSALQPVTLQYLQNYFRGWDWKDSVKVSSSTNVVIASALENGDTLNGVTLATGDRVFLRGQTLPEENGIYIVPVSGAATRALDMDSWLEIPGAVVIVEQGTADADTIWLCTSNQGGTLGTTAITFTQIPTGGGVTGSFTAGQVAYASGTSALTSSNLLFADTSNSRIGINTATPNYPLHIHAAAANNRLQITNTTTGTTTGDGLTLGMSGTYGFISNAEVDVLAFYTSAVERWYINATGSLIASSASNNIGMGITSSLQGNIHIHDTTAALRLSNATTGSGASQGTIVGIGSAGDFQIYNYNNNHLLFATNNLYRAVLNKSGNLNIGNLANDNTYINQTSYQTLILNNLAAQEVLRLRGIASQSGNYFNIVNSSDVSQFRVDSVGDVFIERNKRLILMDADSSNQVTLKSPAVVSSNLDLTLPGSDGNAFYATTTDGAGNLAFTAAEVRLSTTTGFSGTAGTTQTLYTVPTGKVAIITKAIIRCSAATAISVEGFFSIGTNGAFDDIFGNTQLLGLTGTTKIFTFVNSFGASTTAAASSAITFKLNTAYTATTATLTIDLFGYLV